MQPTLLAVRAIGAEFARQLWIQCLIGVLVVSIPLGVLLVWLTYHNTWWWLLDVPVALIVAVAVALLAVFHGFVRSVRPRQTAHQQQQVREFVGKLQLASEVTSTPKFIVLFRTIRSLTRPRSNDYLQKIFETKTLHKDFNAIRTSFREN